MSASRPVRSAQAKGLPLRYRNDDDISLSQPAPVHSHSQTGNDNDREAGNPNADVEGSPSTDDVVEDKILRAQWGLLKGAEIREVVVKTYNITTRWKRNIFYLPTGKAGECFIEELTKVISHFNDGGAFESVSLMMVTIMFPLLLQKPAPNSKTADHMRYLEKRINMWKEGRISELLDERKTIQNRMTRKKKSKSASNE